MSQDPLQVDLQDDDLLDEVQLTAALMAAANRSDAALSTDEIDQLLGLDLPTPPSDSSRASGTTSGPTSGPTSASVPRQTGRS